MPKLAPLVQLFALAAFLCVLLSPSGARAISEEAFSFPESGVSGDIIYEPNLGYDPLTSPRVKVRARNRSSQARSLVIGLKGIVSTTESALLPAGEERELFVVLPAEEDSYYFTVTIDVPQTSEHIEKVSYRERNNYAFGRLGNIHFALNATAPWHDVGQLELLIDSAPQSLVGLRALVIDIDSLTPDWKYKDAVVDWLIQGGTLLLAVDPENPEHDRDLFSGAAFAAPVTTTERGARMQPVGLGSVFYLPEGDFLALDQSFADRILACNICGWSSVSSSNQTSLTTWLPDLVGGPSGGLLLLLLVFAVLVGPLGWRALVAKRGKPFLYLGLVTCCSIVFSGGIVLADKFVHGISTKGRMNSLSLLDQRHEKEFFHEEAVVWAPSSFSEPIVAPQDASLLLFHEAPKDRASGQKKVERGSQVLENALPVRTHTMVVARDVAPPRGRLDVHLSGEQLIVENHLGRSLHQLEVRFEGRRYLARGVDPGAQLKLNPSKDVVPTPPVVKGLLLPAYAKLVGRLSRGELGKNRFWATSEEPDRSLPLLGTNFRSVQAGRHVIAGLL
jgi:hypothetical protein